MKRRLFQTVTLLALLGVAISGCGGGSSDPVAGPLGSATIKLDGGTAYKGGVGGTFVAEADSGITFSTNGTVDTSFSVPAYAWTSDLGTAGVTVAANTVVKVYLGGGLAPIPAANDLFVLPSVSTDSPVRTLYKSNGVSVAGSTVVTGLKVNSGVTLTLPAHASQGGVALEIADLEFTGDVEINGTVKAAGLDNTTVDGVTFLQAQRHGADALAADKAGIILRARRILIGSTGVLNTAGNDGSAGSRGGDAGLLSLYATAGLVNRGTVLASGGSGGTANIGGNGPTYNDGGDQPGGVYFSSTGVIVNSGSATTAGGAGTIGGTGGYITFEAGADMFNTAALTANGGDANGTGLGEGTGGSNDGIHLFSAFASVMNSGSLTARGGNGTSLGGNGGTLDLRGGRSSAVGNVTNSGALDSTGGSALAGGAGGTGGTVMFGADGAVLDSGSIVSAGGAGKGTGNGGNGGSLIVTTNYSADDRTEHTTAAGPVRFSGSIDLSGGAGGSTTPAEGGTGGNINVAVTSFSTYTIPGSLPIEFVGYASLSGSGGGGTAEGGAGGVIALNTYESYTLDAGVELPAGPIFNNVPLRMRGGDAVTAGGRAGFITAVTNSADALVVSANPALQFSTVTNEGAIDLRGGGASGSGGFGSDGGSVYFFGYNSVVNSGAIDARGGDATGSAGRGGDAAENIEFDSTFDVRNSAAISVNGGSGTGTGGSGGTAEAIQMYAGGVVSTTGALSANGGSANGGTNGDGGLVLLSSQSGGTAFGSLTAAKGTGGTGGTDGDIFVDSTLLFGDGVLTPEA